MDIAKIAALVVASYLVGSLPFAYWLCLWCRGVDIRTIGSGNVGATNVLRCAGPGLAIVVFLLDVAKGTGPALAGVTLGDATLGLAAGAGAIIGHSFSPFIGFKGGKGVATTLGVLTGISPITAGVAFGVWIVLVALFRYVSVASLLASLFAVGMVVVRREPTPVEVVFGLMYLLIIYRHRSNIARLMKGEEPKIRLRKPEDEGKPKDT